MEADQAGAEYLLHLRQIEHLLEIVHLDRQAGFVEPDAKLMIGCQIDRRILPENTISVKPGRLLIRLGDDNSAFAVEIQYMSVVRVPMLATKPNSDEGRDVRYRIAEPGQELQLTISGFL